MIKIKEIRTMEIITEEKKQLVNVAKWVAVTYGVEAIKDMAINLPKYIDAYNEAGCVCIEKLRRNEDASNVLAEQAYNEIRENK